MLDNLSHFIGKSFVYKSKYGGITDGIVEKVFTAHCLKVIDGKSGYYTQPIVKVRSTNCNTYDLTEIYIKM